MVHIRKNRFTSGWIEPKAVALNDYDAYLSAAAHMENVICIPEGGFRLRYGMEYLSKIPNITSRMEEGITISAPNGGNPSLVNDGDSTTYFVTTNPIGQEDEYVVVQFDIGVQKEIPYIDIVNASLTEDLTSNQFRIQASMDSNVWIDVGATIRLTNTPATQRRSILGAYRYFRLVRLGTEDLGGAFVSLGEFNVWEDTGDLSQVKLINYRFNIDQSYILALTEGNIGVYREGFFQTNIRADVLTQDRIKSINWTFGGDKIFLCHEDFDVQEVTRRGADDQWDIITWAPENIPFYDFNPSKVLPNFTLKPSAVSGVVTLTASGNVFVAGDVNQIIEGNGGRARITEYTSATVVKAIAEVPFYNDDTIAANNWNLQRGFEPMWSETRGYIRSLAFFQQRLYFGGTRSRPRTVGASVLGDYFNWDQGTGRDTDAFIRDLDNEDPIVNLLPHRALNLFTTSGESAVFLTRGFAITPTSFEFVPQTEVGSEFGLRPVVSNGVIMFVQRGGDSIMQVVFDENQQAYTANNISILASHIIRKPVAFDIRRSTSSDESDMLLIVNADGTMTNGVFMSEENIRGFSLTSTDGKIVAVASDGYEMFFVTHREINGATVSYLERGNYNLLSDCSVKRHVPDPTNIIDGLDHLEGRTVNVFADGVYLEDRVVENGQIETEVPIQTYADIGLNFIPLVKTLPFEALQQIGDRMGEKKRIRSCYIWFYQSVFAIVNGIQVSMREFDNYLLDQPLPSYTGIKRVEGLRGWDDYGQVVLTQDKPLPLTVLAMRIEASI